MVASLNNQAPRSDPNLRQFRFSVNRQGQNKDWNYELLASKFEDKTGTLSDVVDHIKKGHALCAGLLGGQRRSKDNVIGTQWILLDIDNSGEELDENGKRIKVYKQQLTLDEALADPFVQQYCSLIYTSASHTAEWHRFRLVFLLPQYESDVGTIEAMIRSLMEQFPPDPSCKDASRVFYGNTKAEIPLVNPDVCLPPEWREQAIASGRDEAARKKQQEEERRLRQAEYQRQLEEKGLTPEDTDALVLDALQFIPPRQPGSGNYDECKTVLMALHSHFGEAEAERIAEGWSPSIPGSTWNISKKLRSFKRSGIRIASLFYIAQQHGWRFPDRKTVKHSDEKHTALNSGSDSSDRAPKVVEPSTSTGTPSVSTFPHVTADDSNGNGSNGGGGNDDGDDDDFFSEENEWNAPVSWNGEIGRWAIKKVRKTETDPETGETIPVNDAKGRPVFEEAKKFCALCNFDFQVERELSSQDSGGLLLQIKRSVDDASAEKRVIIKSTDYSEVTRFVDALKTVLGSGVVANLKKEGLGALIHTRIKEYRLRGGRTYRLAERIGQQPDGTWVFEDIQFTRDGNPTTEEESGWVFNPNLGGEDRMPSPKIVPPEPTALKGLVDAMLKFHGKEGILPALMALGFVAAGVHYQEIMRREGHFPLINLYGDAGSNKSVAAQNALSLVGWANLGNLHRITVSAVYEWLKLSGSQTSCLDDPERSRDLDELLKGLYDGRARKVRGNYQEPHSPLIVTSNHTCGDDQPATLSRLIQVPFYRQTDGDTSAWDEMQEAQRLASGALPDLIKLGYPAGEVRQLASELRGHLPNAHARVADSLGLVTWYAMAVARLAEFPESLIKFYVIKHLCKTANDADSVADSLNDFIDKLHSLYSESLAGSWSVRTVETDIGTAIAVNMSTVWPLIDKQFSPTYSRKVLESLIHRAGGKIQSVQKFHRSKDETLAYLRNLLNPRTDHDGAPIPTIEPEMTARRCVLIPAAVATDFITSWRNPEPPSSEDSSASGDGNLPPTPPNAGDKPPLPESAQPVTSVTSSYVQLHQKCNQQELCGESVSAITDSPVTFFEKGMDGLKNESSLMREVNHSTGEDESKHLGHTSTLEKNVTGADLDPEIQTVKGFQRLHSLCNSDVTDVTERNQDGVEPLAPPPERKVASSITDPLTPVLLEGLSTQDKLERLKKCGKKRPKLWYVGTREILRRMPKLLTFSRWADDSSDRAIVAIPDGWPFNSVKLTLDEVEIVDAKGGGNNG